MNCCIQDAWNLGWKLGMVETGLANVSLLESYEAERRPIAEQVIWAASSLHETFMGHGKDISERGEQMEDPAYLEKVVGCCSGISYTYRDYIQQYPELEALQGPAIGDRAPDADLENGQSLFRLLGDTRFTLLASSLNDEQSEMVATLAENYPKILKLEVLDNSPVFNARYQTEGKPVLFLVRPDGYIGFRCLVNETDALENFLSEIVRPN